MRSIGGPGPPRPDGDPSRGSRRRSSRRATAFANLLDWAAGCMLIYGVLFGTGKLLLTRVRFPAWCCWPWAPWGWRSSIAIFRRGAGMPLWTRSWVRLVGLLLVRRRSAPRGPVDFGMAELNAAINARNFKYKPQDFGGAGYRSPRDVPHRAVCGRRRPHYGRRSARPDVWTPGSGGADALHRPVEGDSGRSGAGVAGRTDHGQTEGRLVRLGASSGILCLRNWPGAALIAWKWRSNPSRMRKPSRLSVTSHTSPSSMEWMWRSDSARRTWRRSAIY